MTRHTTYTTVAAVAVVGLMLLSPTAAALELINPTGGEYFSGTETVEWTDDSDEEGYELTLYASGAELEPELCELCPGFTFQFDTTAYADGSEYVLRIDDDAGSSTNNNDDEEVTTSGTFTIDNTPPSTTSFLDGTQGDDGWFTTDVTVELIGSDETAGVAETLYSVDGAAEETYTDSFRVTGDAVHTVDFHSVDRADNVEDTRTIDVAIDTTDPSSTLDIGEPSADRGRVVYVTSDTELTLSADDATSGVDHIEYRVNEGAYQVYDGPFTLSGEDGEQVLEWRAVDNAGNVEDANRILLALDDTVPALDRDRPQPGGVYVEDTLIAETHPLTVEAGQLAASQHGTVADTVGFATATGNLTVEATSSDAGSGVSEVRFFVDGELRFTDTERPFEWTWPTSEERLGEHDLTIESEDRVSNVVNTTLPVEVVPTGFEGLNATVNEGPSIPAFIGDELPEDQTATWPGAPFEGVDAAALLLPGVNLEAAAAS